MKTRKAFALKDFDERKIFQRPYFKQFNLPNVSDAEIIESLKPTGDESIADMEKKLNQIKSLHTCVQNYHNNRLIRHHRRYEKLYVEWIVSHKKIKLPIMPIEYLNASMAAHDLLNELSKLFYEIEKQIQKRYRKQFTANLKKYRKAAGLTQKQLGELIHISPQGMSHYAKGDRDMSIPTLARVVKILNISADKLLGIE